jgi:hypothetical protein
MSMNWNAASDAAAGRGRRCGWTGSWRIAEIAAMVLGFIVFWPIGLAVLAFKIWQQRTGYEGDLAAFCRSTVEGARAGRWGDAPFGAWTNSWRGCGRWRGPRTGNHAFDAWRDAELARLEEERRKLETAEREFAAFMDDLRKARDREEFDRFMRERRNQTAQPSA